VTHDGKLHVAVALEGAGWHPAAWREPSARPAELFTARYWVDMARLAEQGLLDFLTIEDSLAPPDHRTDLVRGRLDAVMVAARVAPETTRIGLVPSVTVTHTEPFHISKAIATLDFVSSGRAGVRVQVSARSGEADQFGRRTFPSTAERADPAQRLALRRDLLDEAADYVEVLRRLWDSWEDEAEIRDASSGRFIDRAKLHYIDFTGRWFSVRGPSITPRSPQAQPLVTALAHSSLPYRFALGSADIVLITPHDVDDASRIVGELDALRQPAGRGAGEVTILADLVVFLGPTTAEASNRKSRLDEMGGQAFVSDAAVFVGTAAGLADLMEAWAGAGLHGFRLRPAGLPDDLLAISGDLVPELQRRGRFRAGYGTGTLRTRLGVGRPANRHAAAQVIV
jgi:alkanesulfonate monooxygenase SsuD/methylene tetrahydromethanopterin reductase-like flavin-dependent oxidoreductase (luciferase family)